MSFHIVFHFWHYDRILRFTSWQCFPLFLLIVICPLFVGLDVPFGLRMSKFMHILFGFISHAWMISQLRDVDRMCFPTLETNIFLDLFFRAFNIMASIASHQIPHLTWVVITSCNLHFVWRLHSQHSTVSFETFDQLYLLDFTIISYRHQTFWNRIVDFTVISDIPLLWMLIVQWTHLLHYFDNAAVYYHVLWWMSTHLLKE